MKRTAMVLCTISLSFVAAFGQVNVENRSDVYEAEQYANIIAHEIMSFDTLNVIIFPLPKGTKLEGAVTKDKVNDHTYVLSINESMSLKRMKVMIAHEFVHIKQYEHEGLAIFGDIWEWNPDNKKSMQGVTWGSMAYTDYDNRAFENDAFEKQWVINKALNKILKNEHTLAKRK